MSSEPTLDLELLAAPISEEHPSGTYLKDTDYDRFQEAKDRRAKAVAAERKERELMLYSEEDLQMIPEQDRYVEPPDWRSVREQCVDILANHSKDLWVASWLVEANTRLAGFAGLRDSCQLIDELAQRYWSDIHPPPDEEEGYLGTVSQLTSLNGEEGPGTLIAPIERAPLIPGRDDLNSEAYRQATQGSAGDITEGDFLSAARAGDPEALRTHGNTIQEAIDAFASMIRTLEDRCGEIDRVPVAPPSTQIRSTLTDCQRVFNLIAGDILGSDVADDELIEGDASAGGGGSGSLAQSQVTNREDAFRLLLRVSDFFRKTEPHSPVSYMLQQAVEFGRMALPDLLRELINDEEVLTRFAERTGIEIKSDDAPE